VPTCASSGALCGSHGERRATTRPDARPLAITSRRPAAFMLLAPMLMVPIIAAVNPIDPAWQPGWHDEADADWLLTRTMSPESMLTPVVAGLECLWARACPLVGIEQEHGRTSSRAAVPRGPPKATGAPLRWEDGRRVAGSGGPREPGRPAGTGDGMFQLPTPYKERTS